MSEFQLVEEFQRFLEAELARDPEFVRREIYFMAKNCSDEGLDCHVPLYPLFLHQRITEKYARFGRSVHKVLERILEVLMEPEHPMGPVMRQFLTVQPEVERILETRPRGGVVPRVVRPDTVLHGDRIIAHEFNVSWPGGIGDADIIRDNLEQNALYRRFVVHANLLGVDLPAPRPYLCNHMLLEECLDAADKSDPYIAVVIPTPDVPPFGGDEVAMAQRITQYFRDAGYDADLIHPHEVRYEGQPHYEGRKIDVVYRIFEWGHVRQAKGDEYDAILQAYADGNLPVVNSFHSEAVSAKSIFELLHCRPLHPAFDDIDLEELLEAIPFTANLANVHDLGEVLEEKDRWVLKRIKGSAADAVLLGVMADHAAWEHAVRYGHETGEVVVQEYVDSPMMLMSMFPEEELVQEARYVDIDPFMFSGRLGNFFARFSAMRITSAVGVAGGMFPVIPVWYHE